MMTKKDFKAFAKIFDDAYERYKVVEIDMKSTSKNVVDYIVDRCVELFEEENPRFDRAKFYKACGLI